MGLFQKIIFIISLIYFFSASFMAEAAFLNDTVNFSIDKDRDASLRTEVKASLVKISPKLYFFVEKNWWDQQVQAKKNEILDNLEILSEEFDKKIYPDLVSIFGSEWKPGVDADEKITVLFHAMKDGAGGYFRTADEYIKMQLPDSNEREMVYLPIAQIDDLQLKVFLAHEFMHLITFNQKDRASGTVEDTWLNEARADYSSTILGYDNSYEGSNLQRRVKAFLEKPGDSVTDWQDNKYDYASASVFMHYLVDHYGINILVDSLKSKLAGIESLNYALQKNSATENFSQIFTNWTITVAINDCSSGEKYCYLNINLQKIRISPTINFLPLQGNSSLSVTNVIKNWAGNWQKIIGGNGDLKLEFSSLAGLNFKIPYLIYDKSGNYSLNFLPLDQKQKGQINILEFGSEKTSLIIIPSLQSKIYSIDFSFTYPYTFSAFATSATEESPSENQQLIDKLLAQIDFLKKEILRLQTQQGKTNPNNMYCFQIENDLYFGMQANREVKCLQEFLKNQGQSIYPEGLVTGNFGNLTKKAVINFQEKYKEEILIPANLQQGTGFVGSYTRIKINGLLAS